MKKTIYALLLGVLCASCLAAISAKKKDRADQSLPNVSLISLLATPEKYDGKRVRVHGVFALAYEVQILFPSPDLALTPTNGFWIDDDFSESLSDWAAERKKTKDSAEETWFEVRMEATFVSAQRGHLGLCSGGFKDVTRFDWIRRIQGAEPGATANGSAEPWLISNVRQKMLRVISIFAVLGLAGCSKVLVPDERTAIFPQERAPDLLGLCLHPPEGIAAFWTPEKKDLGSIEDGLQEYLLAVWAKSGHERKEMPEWKDYYRQVGGVVRNGERLLFISYAWAPTMKNPESEAERKKEAEARGRRYDPDWWKTQGIFVHDGGSMFFRVIYDPKKRQFVWYDDNGSA